MLYSQWINAHRSGLWINYEFGKFLITRPVSGILGRETQISLPSIRSRLNIIVIFVPYP